MMLNQSVILFREYPRSIVLISTIQFGIYFVCNGMLLFFPDIINQTAKYLQTSSNDVTLCKVVEYSIEAKINVSNIGVDVKTCVEELNISAYYYALILESCYTVGFLTASPKLLRTPNNSQFYFIFHWHLWVLDRMDTTHCYYNISLCVVACIRSKYHFDQHCHIRFVPNKFEIIGYECFADVWSSSIAFRWEYCRIIIRETLFSVVHF